jgi:hypothetical protein
MKKIISKADKDKLWVEKKLKLIRKTKNYKKENLDYISEIAKVNINNYLKDS